MSSAECSDWKLYSCHGSAVSWRSLILVECSQCTLLRQTTAVYFAFNVFRNWTDLSEILAIKTGRPEDGADGRRNALGC